MRESELHRHIYERSGALEGLAGAFGEVVVGPGDDCAVVRTASGDLLALTVDQLVEGRHFTSELLRTDEGIALVARKAVARSVSDLCAMGARPNWALGTGLLPDGFICSNRLFDDMFHAAGLFGCPLIGGDIASLGGPGALSLTVMCAGSFDEGSAPVLRSGARVGDSIWVTGQIGGSLESGWHLRFEPRIAQGLAASACGRVHAMIDISDGLGRDAARVGVASGVTLALDAGRVPVSDRSKGWREAVSEGEDYELLIVAEGDEPPFGAEAGGMELLGPIGVVREERGEGGAVIVDPHGERHAAADLGWDH